jgi:hypothetical protein
MVGCGRSAASASSENALARIVRATSSTSQKVASGAPMSVAAALAIACSTRPVSSDEETAWLTRASVRSRSKSLSNSCRGVGRTEVSME